MTFRFAVTYFARVEQDRLPELYHDNPYGMQIHKLHKQLLVWSIRSLVKYNVNISREMKRFELRTDGGTSLYCWESWMSKAWAAKNAFPTPRPFHPKSVLVNDPVALDITNTSINNIKLHWLVWHGGSPQARAPLDFIFSRSMMDLQC